MVRDSGSGVFGGKQREFPMSTAKPATKSARRAATLAAVALAAGACLFGGSRSRAADKTVDWKPAAQALLRIDNRPVNNWNVFQDGKKTNPLLLQIGKRFLLIDSKEQKVFELDPAKLKRKDDDLYWNTADLPHRPLKTSNWSVRDVGLAYLVEVRLAAEKHTIDLQLPHPIDIRPLY
jgi:hypothetical protein